MDRTPADDDDSPVAVPGPRFERQVAVEPPTVVDTREVVNALPIDTVIERSVSKTESASDQDAEKLMDQGVPALREAEMPVTQQQTPAMQHSPAITQDDAAQDAAPSHPDQRSLAAEPGPQVTQSENIASPQSTVPTSTAGSAEGRIAKTLPTLPVPEMPTSSSRRVRPVVTSSRKSAAPFVSTNVAAKAERPSSHRFASRVG